MILLTVYKEVEKKGLGEMKKAVPIKYERVETERFWQYFWDACRSKETFKSVGEEQLSEFIDCFRVLRNHPIGAVKALFTEVIKKPNELLMSAATLDKLLEAYEAIELARLTGNKLDADKAVEKFDDWVVAVGVTVAAAFVAAGAAKVAKSALGPIARAHGLVNEACEPNVVRIGEKSFVKVYHYTNEEAAESIAKTGLRRGTKILGIQIPGWKIPGAKLFVTTRPPEKFTSRTFELLTYRGATGPTHCVEFLIPKKQLGRTLRSVGILQEKGSYFIKSNSFMRNPFVPPEKLTIHPFQPIRNAPLEAAEKTVMEWRAGVLGTYYGVGAMYLIRNWK